MPTPADATVYTASPEAQGTVALAILVELLRAMAVKSAVGWDDVGPILDAAARSQVGPTQRQSDARAVLKAIRDMMG
ncbi:hypothetical protein FHP25_23290 [Vineibacter terrae]|uniref:Uncharacterized protein n=1 Tax=Vineibacter terrae TaxID=2586908 RepID=A0A5C8PGG3_9HYPH|nr:hypothetical protein [Vineibacter terrae]TXL72912.1 hypothetical protein FHP25_23290 [Vineibacter terrae]